MSTCTIRSCRQVCRVSSRRRSSPQCCHRPQCMHSLHNPKASHHPWQAGTHRFAVIDEAIAWLHGVMPDRCSHARMCYACPIVHKACIQERAHCMIQTPVAQSAPLYPAPHVQVHDPVVPPGVPCVESQTIVPAVLPSPAVHALAAKSKGIPSSMPTRHQVIEDAIAWLHGMMHDTCSRARMMPCPARRMNLGAEALHILMPCSSHL
jgi:hypothetical protein